MSALARRASRAAGFIAAAVLLLFPLYFALEGSLAPAARLFSGLPLVPHAFGLEHYRALLSERSFWLPLRNSLVVAASTTALAVGIGTPCAYALARLRFRGKRVLVAAILAIGMFPQISIVAPLYLLLRALGWIDTYPGLIFPYLTFAMPLTVWLLVGYFRQLPVSLEEAARVDGASRLAALWRIVIPLALPGIATTAILTFIYSWNEFLFALSFTLGPERQTLPVAIALLRGRYQVPWGEVLAAALVATLPVAAVALAFQRRITRSFGRSGLRS